MTDRSIRRAAERKALKAARKAAQNTQSTASQAQIAANRANAQLAQGPTSPEGIAISSRNHTTHGLTAEPCPNFKVLPGEKQSAYDAALASYQAEWKPATATENELVTRLATHSWLRDRATRLQNQLLGQFGEGEHMKSEDRKLFDLYARYHNTNARAFSKAFSELMRLRIFQLRQIKDQTLLERRALETQIRFESQKRAAELHAAKLETIRLKQEAIKQRTQRTAKPEPPAQTAAQQSASASSTEICPL